jgi:hypothetical protein
MSFGVEGSINVESMSAALRRSKSRTAGVSGFGGDEGSFDAVVVLAGDGDGVVAVGTGATGEAFDAGTVAVEVAIVVPVGVPAAAGTAVGFDNAA